MECIMDRLQALGLVIRDTRKAKHISQEKLAELAQLHRNFVGLVERAETKLAIDSLFAIADALSVPASQLMQDAEALLASSRQT